MSIYYIQFSSGGSEKLFSFDSTSDIVLEDNGDATSFPLESGEDVADHYVNKNVMVRMSGTISDIKTRSMRGSKFNSTTQEFISDLRELKRQGTPFKLYLGSNLGTVSNCVFESLNIEVKAAKLSNNREIGSFKVSFTAKQIKLGTKAQVTIVPSTVIFKTTAPERPMAGQKVEAEEEDYTDAKRALNEWARRGGAF